MGSGSLPQLLLAHLRPCCPDEKLAFLRPEGACEGRGIRVRVRVRVRITRDFFNVNPGIELV